MAIKQAEYFEYDNAGYAIVPSSETKVVTIPSPPTTYETFVKPRPAVIYLTGGKVRQKFEKLDELKAYCEEKQLVFLCPFSNAAEEIETTYNYIKNNYSKINVKRDQILIRADAENMDASVEVVDLLLNDLDVDVDDAEELNF